MVLLLVRTENVKIIAARPEANLSTHTGWPRGALHCSLPGSRLVKAGPAAGAACHSCRPPLGHVVLAAGGVAWLHGQCLQEQAHREPFWDTTVSKACGLGELDVCGC